MLGVDAVYFTQTDVSMLIEKAYQEKRIILSRNTKLKHIDGLTDFFFIMMSNQIRQLSEVLKYFKIRITHDHLFTRCLTCNQKLIVGNHEDIKGKVPPYILGIHKEFSLCPQCKKVYWKGTHLKKMKEIIWKVRGKKNPNTDFIDA